MINHEYVPVELVASIAKLDLELVERRLRRLNKLGLVQRSVGGARGYVLTSRGYDCLAFYVLARRGVLEALSQSPVGEGKESRGVPWASRPAGGWWRSRCTGWAERASGARGG
uniref:RIO2 kinase winged helix domain-containing protein n=1 Tax=Thermofilum pendens TaxID=2269 RepID=A0A7C3SLN8_THEPE